MEGNENILNLTDTYDQEEESQPKASNISLHSAVTKSKLSKSRRPSLKDISEEWAQVPSSGYFGQESGKVCTMAVSVEEAFCHLRSSDLLKVEYGGGADQSLRWTELLHHWLRAPPKLATALKPELDLVLTITQLGLDWSDSIHWRMLQTVYKRLRSETEDCPQYGNHWLLIGFQGSDPSRDLRGVGLLGLLQMLYLASGSALVLARKLLAVSNSREQPFPLAVLSLNVTSIAVNALRAGRLNKECNSRHSVFDVVNQFYAVIINYIYNVWTEEKKTLKDSGILLKAYVETGRLKNAERHCNRHVRRLLRELPVALAKHTT